MYTVKMAFAKRAGLLALAFVLAIGLSAAAAFAQPAAKSPGLTAEGDEVVVGTSTETGYSHPYCSYYKNGGTQTIYTAAELGGEAGDITSIAYYVASGGPAVTSSVKIYMGHTNQSAFSSNAPINPTDGWTLVYSGSPTLGEATGWEQRVFQNAFEYNGQDNLLVCVVRQSTVDNRVYYNLTTTENNMVFHSQHDNDAAPYESAETFVSSAQWSTAANTSRPNTQFTIMHVSGPKFTTQPEGFTYQAGNANTTALTAVAKSADDSFTYQWYKSDSANLKADNFSTATPIGEQGTATVSDGSATITYTPAATTLGTTAGTMYLYCAATDSAGTNLSKPATVYIYTATAQAPTGTATIESNPAATEGAVSANALTCATLTATGAQPAEEGDELHYQWFMKADGETEFVAIEGATESTYSARAELDKTNTYRYEVWASHEVPTNVSTHVVSSELTVTGKPVTIGSEAELRAFAEAVNAGNSYEGMTVSLTNDIVLTSAWTPIGAYHIPFKGTFDGGGHVISGLSIESTSDYQGLFGYVDGDTIGSTIKDFVVQGSGVSGKEYVAGVVARTEGKTTIQNVGNEVPVNSTTGYTGGIVGMSNNDNAQIIACYNKAPISTSCKSARTGGIVGYCATSTEVISCYNTGTVTCTASTNNYGIGGICGYDGMFYNCINTGLVTDPGYSTTAYHGAIVGEQGHAGTGNDTCYYLSGSSDKPSNNNNVTAIELTADQLSGAAYYNDAPLLNALNAGSYNGNWLDSSDQDSPKLFWEVAEGSPTITTQPVGAEYAANDTIAALTCEAEYPKGSGSDEGLVYKWFTASDKETVLATGKTFTPTVAPNSQEIFVCVVINPNDGNPVSITSRTATIKVLGDYAAETPVFTTPEEATTIDGKILNETRLEAEASVEKGDLTYQWFSCEDAQGTNPQAIDSKTSTTYKFKPTNKGTYYFFCRATNTDTFARSGEQVAEADSPVFTIEVGDYTISTPYELKLFQESVNPSQNFEGVTVSLKADLDLQEDPETEVWTPIQFFAGTFDGEGHTIDGMEISSESAVQGLFGTLRGNAVVKNLIIGANSSVKGLYQVGGIAGSAMATSGPIQIINCGNNATVQGVLDSFDNSCYAGGIVGYTQGSVSITACYNKGTISGKANGVGGIAGGASSYTSDRYAAVITSCYNAGTVFNAKTNCGTGGISGWYTKVVNCVNVGSLPGGATTDNNGIGAIGGLNPKEVSDEGNDASYYLDTSCVNPVGCYETWSPADEVNCHTAAYYIPKTAAELSASDMVDTLNVGDYKGAWVAGSILPTPLDYPVLRWEAADVFKAKAEALDELAGAITAAQAIDTSSLTSEQKAALEAAIAAAEKAVAEADSASLGDIQQAIANIKKAAKAAKDAIDAATEKPTDDQGAKDDDAKDSVKDSTKDDTAKAKATKKVKSVTVNVKTVTAKAVAKAIKKAGGAAKYVTKITLGSKCKTVKAKALSKCVALKTLVVGKNVKKLKAKAFYKCKKLKTVTVKSKKLTKKAVKGCFKGCKSKKVKLKAPKAKKKAYKKFFTKKNCGKKVKVS